MPSLYILHADTAWQIEKLHNDFNNPSTNFSVSVRAGLALGPFVRSLGKSYFSNFLFRAIIATNSGFYICTKYRWSTRSRN